MKKIFLAAISIVCLMASCSKDEMETPAVNPLAGNEVMFTSSVGEATRTLYGEESDTGNSIAVKWVTGDLISVYGADCSLKQAEYKVTAAANATTANGMNYYYAESLDKTGETGVQWGSSGVSDFFAVYPSTPNSFKANTDGSATVKTTVRASQNVAFKKTTIKVDGQNQVLWTSQHFKGNSDNPSMTDAVMYAYTNDAVATNADGTAKAVDLKFKPFSTVLRFTMKGFQSWMKDGETETIKDSELAVNRIILTAPTGTNIAGDFNLTIKNNGNGNGTATAEAGTTNQITIYPEYLPLKNNEWVEFDVFTIPQDSVVLSKDKPWTVEVETTLGLFTYKLIPQKLENGTLTNSDAPLTAGALHKLTIPQKKVYLGFEIPVDAWLEYIPRNVYLSELSYPGAWYATNSDYQGTATLTDMYTSGVRAFNIDCRMTASADSWEKHSSVLGNYYTIKDNPQYVLQCAGSETLEGINVLGGTRVSSIADGKSVESQLEELAKLITDEEFIIVVLTIAEKPKDLSGSLSGNTQSFGNNVDPAKIMAAIKDILRRKGSALKVFGCRTQDADKTLNANTTVNDVLGSMVIKINLNVDQDATALSNYEMSNVLISEGSMASESKYITSPIVAGSFTSMNEATMYWGSASTNPEMKYYYHQAQLTTSNKAASSGSSTPSLYDRMLAVDNIINKSSEIYAQKKHNALYQLGIGGYINNRGEDRATVASTMNQYVLDHVTTKLATTPSPIGIVLMNFCMDNTYKSKDLIEKILDMNTSFYLNRNTEAKEWPNGSPFQDVEVDTPPSSGGDDGQLGDN